MKESELLRRWIRVGLKRHEYGDRQFTHHCDIVETGNTSWRFKNRS